MLLTSLFTGCVHIIHTIMNIHDTILISFAVMLSKCCREYHLTYLLYYSTDYTRYTNYMLAC